MELKEAEQLVDRILELERKLPKTTDERILKRLIHVKDHGHLLILKEEGRVVGIAECYRLRKIPKWPVRPLPTDDPKGGYLYCWAASCEKGKIKKLIELGKRTFPNHVICYHRRRHGNKLYVEKT